MEIRLSNLLLSESILDASVLDKKDLGKNEEIIGEVANLHLDPEDLTIEGIRVDNGIFKFDHHIGKNYIEKFSDNGVILNITPLNEFEGEKVRKIK